MSQNQLCFRFNSGQASQILPTQLSVTQSFSSSLIHPAGIYQYNEYRYDCTQAGLYCWFAPGVDTTHRIIYDGDVYALMSALSELAVHGRADEWKTDAQKTTAARTSFLRLRCGPLHQWAKTILASIGIQSRLVSVLTAETPNGYDDGHVAIEVLVGGQWKLWDLTNDCYMTASDGTHLSLKAAIDSISDNSETLQQIANHYFSYEPFESGQFDVTMFGLMKLNTEAARREWIRRIYKIPGITHSDSLTYFTLPAGSESRAAWVTGLSASYRVVSKTTFDAMFY